MKYNLFFRNVRAREQLDIFLVAAIGSLLLTRFFLYITGYPQLGGGSLHIGHMLWGGLFMLAGITINLAFLGLRVQRLSALLGGIGFGIFIDEIGKFITSDNNYFFRPTVGIIYAIFIIIYLTFSFLGRQQKLSNLEYQLSALAQIEEAILHDMDPVEKRMAKELLSHADRRSPVTKQLKLLLDQVELVPQNRPRFYRRLLAWLDALYVRFWRSRNNRRVVRIFFLTQAVIFVLVIFANIYDNLDDVGDALAGNITYGFGLLIGQFVSSMVAAAFVLIGAFRLKNARMAAFEDFRRATLINIFLTEFFLFSRIQFAALPEFVFNLAVLLLITYVMHQERRSFPEQSVT